MNPLADVTLKFLVNLLKVIYVVESCVEGLIIIDAQLNLLDYVVLVKDFKLLNDLADLEDVIEPHADKVEQYRLVAGSIVDV